MKKASFEGGGIGGFGGDSGKSGVVPAAWFAGGGKEAGLQPGFRSSLDALIAEGNATGHHLGVTELPLLCGAGRGVPQ